MDEIELDVKQNAILAGIGTGAFGILMAIGGWHIGLSNITGQGCIAIAGIFIVISGGSFLKPELIGPVAMKILQNQQKNLTGGTNSRRDTQSVDAKDVGGNVVTTGGSHNTIIFVNNGLDSLKSNNTKTLDSFIFSMYYLGESGQRGVGEDSLKSIPNLSKMDIFQAIEEATSKDLIIDISTHDGTAWMLNQKGIRYAHALIENIKK